jgi:hypothetical protein
MFFLAIYFVEGPIKHKVRLGTIIFGFLRSGWAGRTRRGMVLGIFGARNTVILTRHPPKFPNP